ncbi:P-aminobenzoate N-oxygenase AurF [Paraburkholderia steynii]|uniref:p-aminobenzoate N-oxygenase AurF n=1 Tax=Paraburkholderia steynii TaxID=1245441 RepID=A0A7Z7BKQ6_9BURK|nr:diiron oxygenase [Paraburkholderia steynii]SDJ47431.1 P-aminobenzoate N-oxygenase AurF [Paraburkholderia steynii]
MSEQDQWDEMVHGGDAMRSAFAGWDKEASVRRKPMDYDCSTLSADDIRQKHWFLPSALPYFEHPSVKSLGMQASQTLQAHALVYFMEYTALLEHRVVNRCMELIAHDLLPVALPESTRQDAMLLYTDEGYHAFISAEVSRQVARLIGIVPDRRQHPRVQNLINHLNDVPENFKALGSFLTTFVSETVITKEFLKFSNGTVVAPVSNVLKDHLDDERYHARYFSRLFDYVWKGLNESDRNFCASFLPKMIFQFYRINVDWVSERLQEVGLSKDDALEISSLYGDSKAVVNRAKNGATSTMHAIKRAGVLSNPEHADHFKEVGLIN